MKGKPFALGLIGWPLGHSLSPRIHDAALRSTALEGEYRLYPIPSAPAGLPGLEALLDRMRQGEIDGLNVTRPYKQIVLDQLDHIAPTASATGAVNTIARQNNGLVGHNTDKDGFLADLDAQLSPERGTALVLGAGGAARAVVAGLCERGWRVWVAARRLEQAESLKEGLGRHGHHAVRSLPLTSEAIASIAPHCSLIVNATPLGTAPQTQASPWPAGVPFPEGASLYDLVYSLQGTGLTQSASMAGLAVATGVGMLIKQAALAFALWTGLNPSEQVMLDAIIEDHARSRQEGGG